MQPPKIAVVILSHQGIVICDYSTEPQPSPLQHESLQSCTQLGQETESMLPPPKYAQMHVLAAVAPNCLHQLVPLHPQHLSHSVCKCAILAGRWRNLEVAVKTVLFSHKFQTSGSSATPPTPSSQRAIMEAAVSTSVVHRNVLCT